LSLVAVPLDAAAGTLRLRLEDGLGNGVVVTDTDGDGVLFYMGAVGAFNLTIATAASSPFLGNDYLSEMHLDNMNITTTTGGTLTLTLEDTGFTATVGSPAALTSTIGGSFGWGGGSITTQSFVNTLNSAPNLGPNGPPTTAVTYPSTGTVSTAQQTYTSQAFGGQSSVEFVATGPYALFSRTVFTLNAGSVGSFNLNTSVATPEPASLLLFGSGLIGVARLVRRRREEPRV
jgi:hypothetical protein